MNKKKSNDKRLKNLISLYVSDLLYDKIIEERDSSENRHHSINSLINEILEKHYNLYGNVNIDGKPVSEDLTLHNYLSLYEGFEDDEAMQNEHIPLFLVMIDRMIEKDLSNKIVLDFGCNQGLFLKLLYRIRPFKQGYGIDLLEDSIKIANNNKGDMPLEYKVTNDISEYNGKIDIAFSHEVVYLLPDLDKHAKNIYNILRDNGSYYVALGQHTDNPLWESWKQHIEETTSDKVQDYSLDDVFNAFETAGFDCYVQKFMLNNFIKIKKNKYYFQKVVDGLNFFWDYKTLFRFEKK